jgi:hypothetical protein
MPITDIKYGVPITENKCMDLIYARGHVSGELIKNIVFTVLDDHMNMLFNPNLNIAKSLGEVHYSLDRTLELLRYVKGNTPFDFKIDMVDFHMVDGEWEYVASVRYEIKIFGSHSMTDNGTVFYKKQLTADDWKNQLEPRIMRVVNNYLQKY